MGTGGQDTGAARDQGLGRTQAGQSDVGMEDEGVGKGGTDPAADKAEQHEFGE